MFCHIFIVIYYLLMNAYISHPTVPVCSCKNTVEKYLQQLSWAYTCSSNTQCVREGMERVGICSTLFICLWGSACREVMQQQPLTPSLILHLPSILHCLLCPASVLVSWWPAIVFQLLTHLQIPSFFLLEQLICTILKQLCRMWGKKR